LVKSFAQNGWQACVEGTLRGSLLASGKIICMASKSFEQLSTQISWHTHKAQKPKGHDVHVVEQYGATFLFCIDL